VLGLSQIIEDNEGYHIVEVLAREQDTVQPFADAQADIRKLLVKQKVSKLKSEFIQKVRDETPVWTKWPSDIPGSKDISLLTR
jgi:parvulin-like peptidyl-prolyl isomerase